MHAKITVKYGQRLGDDGFIEVGSPELEEGAAGVKTPTSNP